MSSPSFLAPPSSLLARHSSYHHRYCCAPIAPYPAPSPFSRPGRSPSFAAAFKAHGALQDVTTAPATVLHFDAPLPAAACHHHHHRHHPYARSYSRRRAVAERAHLSFQHQDARQSEHDRKRGLDALLSPCFHSTSTVETFAQGHGGDRAASGRPKKRKIGLSVARGEPTPSSPVMTAAFPDDAPSAQGRGVVGLINGLSHVLPQEGLAVDAAWRSTMSSSSSPLSSSSSVSPSFSSTSTSSPASSTSPGFGLGGGRKRNTNAKQLSLNLAPDMTSFTRAIEAQEQTLTNLSVNEDKHRVQLASRPSPSKGKAKARPPKPLSLALPPRPAVVVDQPDAPPGASSSQVRVDPPSHGRSSSLPPGRRNSRRLSLDLAALGGGAKALANAPAAAFGRPGKAVAEKKYGSTSAATVGRLPPVSAIPQSPAPGQSALSRTLRGTAPRRKSSLLFVRPRPPAITLPVSTSSGGRVPETIVESPSMPSHPSALSLDVADANVAFAADPPLSSVGQRSVGLAPPATALLTASVYTSPSAYSASSAEHELYRPELASGGRPSISSADTFSSLDESLSSSAASASTSTYGSSFDRDADRKAHRRNTVFLAPSDVGEHIKGPMRDPTEVVLEAAENSFLHARSTYSNGPVEVLPGLFLGDEYNARDRAGLRERGIGFVLNVAKEVDIDLDEVVVSEARRSAAGHDGLGAQATDGDGDERQDSPDEISPRHAVVRNTVSTPNLQSSFQSGSPTFALPFAAVARPLLGGGVERGRYDSTGSQATDATFESSTTASSSAASSSSASRSSAGTSASSSRSDTTTRTSLRAPSSNDTDGLVVLSPSPSLAEDATVHAAAASASPIRASTGKEEEGSSTLVDEDRGRMPAAPPGTITRTFPAVDLPTSYFGPVSYVHMPWTHDEAELGGEGGAFDYACAVIEKALGIGRFAAPSSRPDPAVACRQEVEKEKEEEPARGILVHCQCGVSRSATLVIAFVMRVAALALGAHAWEGERGQRWQALWEGSLGTMRGMHDAYDFVKDKSPSVSPNIRLIYQLVDWERVCARQAAAQRLRIGSVHPGPAAGPGRTASGAAAPNEDDVAQRDALGNVVGAGAGSRVSAWTGEVAMDEDEWKRMRAEEEEKERVERQAEEEERARLISEQQERQRQRQRQRGRAASGSSSTLASGLPRLNVGAIRPIALGSQEPRTTGPEAMAMAEPVQSDESPPEPRTPSADDVRSSGDADGDVAMGDDVEMAVPHTMLGGPLSALQQVPSAKERALPGAEGDLKRSSSSSSSASSSMAMAERALSQQVPEYLLNVPTMVLDPSSTSLSMRRKSKAPSRLGVPPRSTTPRKDVMSLNAFTHPDEGDCSPPPSHPVAAALSARRGRATSIGPGADAVEAARSVIANHPVSPAAVVRSSSLAGQAAGLVPFRSPRVVTHTLPPSTPASITFVPESPEGVRSRSNLSGTHPTTIQNTTTTTPSSSPSTVRAGPSPGHHPHQNEQPSDPAATLRPLFLPALQFGPLGQTPQERRQAHRRAFSYDFGGGSGGGGGESGLGGLASPGLGGAIPPDSPVIPMASPTTGTTLALVQGHIRR